MPSRTTLGSYGAIMPAGLILFSLPQTCDHLNWTTVCSPKKNNGLFAVNYRLQVLERIEWLKVKGLWNSVRKYIDGLSCSRILSRICSQMTAMR